MCAVHRCFPACIVRKPFLILVADFEELACVAVVYTTANEYMQELPASVKQMIDSVYGELRAGRNRAAGSVYLLPNATERENRMTERGGLLPNATKRKSP